MKTPLIVTLTLISAIAITCACKSEPKLKPPGPEYDCTAGQVSGYSAVSKTPHNTPTDKHCEVVFDIADKSIDHDPHPRIGLLADASDTLIFKDSSGGTFHYEIVPDAAGNGHPPHPAPPENGCDVLPVQNDPHASDDLNVHDLKAVHIKPGKDECHYKITFYRNDAKHTVIDPHIVIGTGKRGG